MKRAAVLLALVLVLVAGTIPAAMGFARGFRTDRTTLASGEVIEGSVLFRGDTIQVSGREGKREIPREAVRSVEPRAVWTGDHAARALYERLGFRVEGVRRNYYDAPREDAVILWHRALPAIG